jgi:uncharacterized protein involved in exopolysaccharide biosynthesis
VNNIIIDGDQVNLKNILPLFSSLIKKYKLYFFLSFIFALIYFFVSPPTYKSKISFYTNYSESTDLSLSPFLSSVGLTDSNQIHFTVKDFIESDNLLTEIVNKTYMIDDKKITLVEHWGINYKKIFKINPISSINAINRNLMYNREIDTKQKEIHFARAVLKSKISLKENRRDSLNTIIVESEDPYLSKQILDYIYSATINYTVNIASFKAKEKKDFIYQRLLQVKSQLFEAEKKLITFYSSNKSISESPILTVEENRLRRDISILDDHFMSLSAQLETAKIEEKNNTYPLVILDEPSISSLQSQPSLLKVLIFVMMLNILILLGYEIYYNKESWIR